MNVIATFLSQQAMHEVQSSSTQEKTCLHGVLHLAKSCATFSQPGNKVRDKLQASLLRILTAHNFTRDQRTYIKKMAAFSLWPKLASEVNRHFLVNEYDEISFFSLFLN